MSERKFFLVLLIFIVSVTVFLFYKTIFFKEQLKKCNLIIKNTSNYNLDLANITNIINNNLKEELSKIVRNWKLVIIYSPESCPICIDEISFWDKFSYNSKDIVCYGLVNHSYKKIVIDFIQSQKWNFYTKIIDDSRYGTNFGFVKTPIKILLNKTNEIFYIEGPDTNWEQNSKLLRIVEELMK